MSLGGTELLLRPVSAAEYLRARAQAGALAEACGGDGGTGLILGACLVAAGAYDGEQPAFASGAEALERLTPDEILGAAAEYALTSAKTGGETGENTGAAVNNITADKDTEPFGREISGRKAESAPETPPEQVPEADGDGKQGETPERSRLTLRRTPEPAAQPRKELSAPAPQSASFPADGGDRMRRVSDFFERDCRRYDGAFRRY